MANFPWARTNKALGGRTKGAIKGLKNLIIMIIQNGQKMN